MSNNTSPESALGLRQKVGVTITFLLLIGSLAALFYGIYRGLAALDPQIAATIMTASATIIVAVLTVAGGRIIERRKTFESDQQKHWAVIYEEFTTDLIRLFSNDGQEGGEVADYAAFILNFSSKVTIWGSDAVLSEWVTWKKMTVDIAGKGDAATRQDNLDVLFQLESLIRTMRKDLGHKDKNLQSGDILRLFVNDLDQELLASLDEISS